MIGFILTNRMDLIPNSPITTIFRKTNFQKTDVPDNSTIVMSEPGIIKNSTVTNNTFQNIIIHNNYELPICRATHSSS